MSSVMFYESVSDDYYTFQLGYVEINISMFVQALEAAIVLAPLNTLVVFMFV